MYDYVRIADPKGMGSSRFGTVSILGVGVDFGADFEKKLLFHHETINESPSIAFQHRAYLENELKDRFY